MSKKERNSPQAIYFGPYLLKGHSGPLIRDGVEISLRAMPLKMLWYLVNRAGEVIGKEELFKAIWPDQTVGESSLTVCVTEIRVALQDDSRAPLYLQTIHRTGYRFIGQTLEKANSNETLFVGRQDVLELLDKEFNQSVNQECRLTLVCGNPGLGKSALLDAWAEKIDNAADVTVLRARCVEHTGADEPYSPFIFALREMINSGDKEYLAKLVGRLAPGWLLEFPALSGAPAQQENIEETAPQMSAGRMRYEMTDLLAELSRSKPLILMFDDMHWCDTSSAVALSELIREKCDAQLFVVVGYRSAHPAKSSGAIASVIGELKIRHLCTEVNLEPLSDSDVESYVSAALNKRFNSNLVDAVFQRSQGHPLFMSALVRHLALTPAATADDINQVLPENLHTYVDLRLGELTSSERQVLEVASIAGQEFSVAEVESALNAEFHVEPVCESLANRREFLSQHSSAKWPDGTVTGIYRFVHALYPEIMHSSISPARRIRIHSAIAQRLQDGHGEDCSTIASSLAHHHEGAGNAAFAAQMLKSAADYASRLHAHDEAIALLQRGLELLNGLENNTGRAPLELDLLLALGSTQVALKGYAAEDVQTTFNKAQLLCNVKELTPHRFAVMRGLAAFYLLRGEYSTAKKLGTELQTLELDDSWSPDSAQLEGNMVCGVVDFFRGRLTDATTCLRQAISLYDPGHHRSHASIHGLDPGAVAYAFDALCSWLLGNSQRSIEHSLRSIEYAKAAEHPFTLCQCHALVALLHQWGFDYSKTSEHSAQAEALAKKHGFPYLVASEQARRGWLAAVKDRDSSGIHDIHKGIALYKNTGAVGGLTVMAASHAEACLVAGQLEVGLDIIEDALKRSDQLDERLYRAELLRLRGELLKEMGGDENLERSKVQLDLAIEQADQQQARCLQVRATASHAGLRYSEQQGSDALDQLLPMRQELAVYATTPELSSIKNTVLSGHSG